MHPAVKDGLTAFAAEFGVMERQDFYRQAAQRGHNGPMLLDAMTSHGFTRRRGHEVVMTPDGFRVERLLADPEPDEGDEESGFGDG